MYRPYKELVTELLKQVKQNMSHTGVTAPVFVYIKHHNMDTFLMEAKIQFEFEFPKLKAQTIHCIDRYAMNECNTQLFTITQPTFDYKKPFIRYDTIGPAVIFNDMQ